MNLKATLLIILYIIIGALIYPNVIILANTNWQKFEGNPVISESSGSWDNNLVIPNSVIFSPPIYRLWYRGGNGSVTQIGLAESTTGIAWTKSALNPILLINNSSTWEKSWIGFSSVIFDDGVYKIWYTGCCNANNQTQIGYATSTDGTTIIKYQDNPILTPTSGTWDQGSVTQPRVLKINGTYHMWYSGRGGTWEIGYATSPDGINWTKYSNNPVLKKSQSWENNGGDGLGSPSIIYDGSIFHMWYHVSGIGYAQSYDGINWIKYPGNPVVPRGPSGSWDSYFLINPAVIKTDTGYMMWYAGESYDNSFKIGLATTDSLPIILTPTILVPSPTLNITITPTITPTPVVESTPTVTPTDLPIDTPTPIADDTPTSTPTLTPEPSYTNTPTPSNTLSPTKTPIPSSTVSPTIVPTGKTPVIIVVGFLASWNRENIFSCDINQSDIWRLTPSVNIYQNLINTLTKYAGLKMNEDVYLYTYDWRQPLDIQARNLKQYIDNILVRKEPGLQVQLVGHSFGGLVIRSYLENFGAEDKVLKSMTVGTPHTGTVYAYPMWEKGEVWDNSIWRRSAIAILEGYCRMKLSKVSTTDTRHQITIPTSTKLSSKEVIQKIVPSIESLLPTFNYLRRNLKIIYADKMYYKNNWQYEHPIPSEASNKLTTTLSGTGVSTLRFLDVVDPSKSDQKNQDWIDGNPEQKIFDLRGDGTIPLESSQIMDKENIVIGGNHMDIISGKEGIRKILEFIGFTQIIPEEFILPAEKISEKILTVTTDKNARIELLNFRKDLLAQNNDFLNYYNPDFGIFYLKITPLEKADTLISAAIIGNNDEMQVKYYKIQAQENVSRLYLFTYPRSLDSRFNIIPMN